MGIPQAQIDKPFDKLSAHPNRHWLWAIALAAIAFAFRLIPVLRGGGLFGFGNYDDGVYYAAATGLVHGRLPYLDFLLLHRAPLPDNSPLRARQRLSVSLRTGVDAAGARTLSREILGPSSGLPLADCAVSIQPCDKSTCWRARPRQHCYS